LQQIADKNGGVKSIMPTSRPAPFSLANSDRGDRGTMAFIPSATQSVLRNETDHWR
jgi:hypothetical protein